jgi:hypothetical protein
LLSHSHGKILTFVGHPRDMLQPMQQLAENPTPSLNPSSFASLLAALATPASTAADRAPAWNDDGLEDDVATLSYERALRAHARYRSGNPLSADPTDRSLTQPAEPSYEALSAHAATAVPVSANAEAWVTHGPATALDRNLKSSSITIRLSHEECAQLRKRAAEAGLTVSAYLRSCTFEAESLRAMVKDTLAQLRPEPPKRKETASTTLRRSWFGWLLRFFPPWHPSQRVARA